MREMKRVAFGMAYALFGVFLFYLMMVWTGYRLADHYSHPLPMPSATH